MCGDNMKLTKNMLKNYLIDVCAFSNDDLLEYNYKDLYNEIKNLDALEACKAFNGLPNNFE